MTALPFQRSPQTEALVHYLASCAKGDQVDYAKLSEIAGATIDSRSGKLISARRILENTHNQIWVAVKPFVGVRRLDDAGIADRMRDWWLRGARRKVQRGTDQADVVETNKLDLRQQVRFSVACIQANLAQDALSKATQHRVEKVAQGNSNDLPSFNVIEWAITLSPSRKLASGPKE